MGTRADFYIKRGDDFEWLGSVAWDGYDIAQSRSQDGVPHRLKKAKTEAAFRSLLKEYFSKRNDVTLPDMGWPWPWDTSEVTDYTYVFENNKVRHRVFDSKTKWPDMSARRRLAGGNRSGLIVVSVP